ncbi:MAG: hypothetical protein ABIJ16_14420 [Bacteroidota bacterium]
MDTVFKFRIISNEKEDFFRDIEILSHETFFEFHQAIQACVKYDPSQIASFFTSNSKWEKIDEITLMDMSDFDQTKRMVMHRVRLNEILEKKKERLLYVFDFFSERAFFIELTDILKPEKNKNYPVLSNGKGKAPRQILENDLALLNSEDILNEDFRFESLDDLGEF